MKKCRISNYTKELHSNLINLSKLESDNVDDLIEEIYTVLRGLPFSTDIDDSIDEENYNDSINELIKQVKTELEKANLSFQLSTSDKSKITKALKSKLLPKPLTKAEQLISAIIKGTDLVRDEELLSIRYNLMLVDVYGTSNPGMDSWRNRTFEDALSLATIIDTRGDGEIIDTDRKLNNNIINYLESLYKIIRDFLSKYYLKDIDSTYFPKSLYTLTNKGEESKFKVRTSNHYNTLTAMYNIIEFLKNEGTFLDSIENGWNEDIDNNNLYDYNRELYTAVNAFINLTYFDDILKLNLNKFIKINPQFNPILATYDAFGGATYSYKYEIITGNSNARKTWGDEVSDSLEEMAGFNKFIINRISLYDYKEGTKLWGRLEPKDFIGTIVKLKSVGVLISDNTFRQAVENLTTDLSRSNGHLQTIFKKLFIEQNLNIIRELKSKGFDYNNMNVLYAIFRTVFDTRHSTKLNNKTEKSWLEVENAYLKKNGIKSRYNLVEAIYGLICSNTSLNYLQSVYDSDTDTVKTSVKDKYSISKTKFDIINPINEDTIKRLDSQLLLDAYPLTALSDGKSYSINIAGINYKINVSGLGVNILTKKNVSSNKFLVNALENLKSVYIGSRESRVALVNRVNLDETEKLFADVLSFIDTMLGTDFNKNTESLNEFAIAMKGNPNFLHDVFMSAARALVIQDIYNNFRQATKEDGSKYAATELMQYLKSTGKYIGIYDAKNPYEYFRRDYDGFQLTTIDSNEPWVIKLANVRALLAKDTSKSVISNLEGHKIPNSSPAYLCGDINALLVKSSKNLGPTSYLLFTNNRKSILEVDINTDIKTKDGKVKLIKNMTLGELLYTAIIEKFLIPFHADKTVFIQSTTQSDKTKFVANRLNLEDLIINNQKLSELIKSSSLEKSVISAMQSTIGAAYNKVYERVIDDYKKLFPSVNSIDDINNIFKGIPVKINNGLEFIINSEEDLMKAVVAYNKANPSDKITLYKDLHYRAVSGSYIDYADLDDTGKPKKKIKKRLAFNELLDEFATNLYNQKDSTRLELRLNLEKKQFIQDLLDLQFAIPATDLIKTAMKQAFGISLDSWITKVGNEEYVILAKQGNKNILYGDIDRMLDITLNPMLNAYFLVDNLLGNNLRFSTTGSEINHKIKELSKLDLKESIRNLNLNNLNLLLLKPDYAETPLTFYELKQMILKGKDLIKLGFISEGTSLANTVFDLLKAYDAKIYLMENLGENALFKRNVIMSATMTKMVPSLEGISEKMNIACINDIPAEVFNFSGKSDSIDAHDGSAFVSSFLSILENKSLGPNEVGTIKKPIQHGFDDRYMVATLLKYATDTITNLWMRLSVGNDLNNTSHAINLYNIFKKMHNKRWHVTDAEGKSIEGAWLDGEIDLIKGCGWKAGHRISFINDILQGHDLYYNKNGEHYKITDFGRENGIYYTIEEKVDQHNNSYGEKLKVYHLFGEDGHTIDSLYELHSALGGIWSETFDGEKFVYSESSNIAVVNFINHVATLKEGADPNDISIKSYDLPLKRAMIHVLANNSAVKNGVGNINSTSSWYDNSELSYMTIDSDNYGIQQDSDHTADEAHMTEFSLVISSLDAGGYLHDYVRQIYQQLGLTALDLSKVELDSVKNFRKTGNITDIYDVVGRTIMANIKSGRNGIGLAEAIITNIKKKFNLNTDHALDELKIPFSDPNIYSSILSTFVSNINKKSIKRLYPGLGTVMVPSYNISMIYDINGVTYLFEDILKEALLKGFTSTKADNTEANLDIVRQYLKSILDSMPIEDGPLSFIPTENVLVTIQNLDGSINYEHISLNEIHDYYNFLDNPVEYLKNRGYNNIVSLKFLKDVTIPRNLAPARITWDYVDTDGVLHHTNIFNHWRVKGQILELQAISKNKNLSKEEKAQLSKEAINKWNVNKAFHDLKAGIYEILQGAEPVKISNLKNEAAEIIMSNLYTTKFGINSGDSLVDVLKAGKEYFKVPKIEIESDNYDLVFTKGSGNHTFITFKPLLKNNDNCSSFYRAWDNKNIVKYEREYVTSADSPTVVNKVYAITKDNTRLFEIGREIVRDDIVWDNKQKQFIKGGKKVKNLNSYRKDGDRVLLYIEFVSKHSVNEVSSDGAVTSYDLYNINRSAIKQCFELKEEYSERELTYTNAKGHQSKLTRELALDNEVNMFISKLLGDIYKSEDYGSVQINKSLSFGSGKILLLTLYNFSQLLNYDQTLSGHILNLSKIMLAANPNKNEDNRFSINPRKLRNALNDFNLKNLNKQYTSFLKSLYFTAARIPAQTLQSFMKMKNVGFTGTETGQCFVTAWLTWLLGSKINNN